MDNPQINSNSDEEAAQNGSKPILPPVHAVADDAAAGGTDDDFRDDQTVPTSRALVPTPEEASDSDLIEKEWVIKAKQIVEHTAEDPFQQQEELAKMKEDYLKKRYNKSIGSA